MKWRLRWIVEKSVLFLVSIKPVRWFIDQLFKCRGWAQSKPFLCKLWKWYKKLFKPVFVLLCLYSSLDHAWHHDVWGIAMDYVWIVIIANLPDKEDPEEGGDEEPDEPDSTPDGDAVDRWLREQQKISV